MSGGRDSTYTDDIANEICERISLGESVRQICLLEHMPCHATVYNWLKKHPDFLDKYARAKEAQADFFAEELLEIADDGRNDWVEREYARGGGTYIALNEEAIVRSRVRIETRKWLMGKMKPKKYGEKITHLGDDLNPIVSQIIIAPVCAAKPDQD